VKLPIGQTYCRWLVVAHLLGAYLVQCPTCPKQLRKSKTEMERQTSCADCARASRHKGAVLRAAKGTI